MKHNIRFWFWMLVLTGSFATAWGQEDCTKNFLEAQELFEKTKGEEEKIINLIYDCALKSETVNREAMLWLLLQASIKLDDLPRIDMCMYHLLKINPDFDPSRAEDNTYITERWKLYRKRPLAGLRINVGSGFSRMRIMNDFDPFLIDQLGSKQPLRPAFQASGEVDIHIHESIILSTGLQYQYRWLALSRSTSYQQANLLAGDSSYLYSEQQQAISSPLYIRIQPKRFRWIPKNNPEREYMPFIQLGGQTTALIQAQSHVETQWRNFTQQQYELENTLNRRHRLNYNVQAGLGLHYKVMQEWLLTFQATYNFRGRNQVIESQRYSYTNDLLGGHIDPDFQISQAAFSFGITRWLYKPKKCSKIGGQGGKILSQYFTALTKGSIFPCNCNYDE